MSDGGGDGGGGGGGDFGGGGGDWGGGDYNDHHHHGGGGYHPGDDTYNDHHHYYGNDYGGDASPGTAKCILIAAAAISSCVTSIFLGVGVFLTMRSFSYLNELVATEGKIVDERWCGRSGSGSSSGGDTWAAVIEYYDEYNKETYTFSADNCSSWRPSIGNSIKVLYDPEEPGRAVNASFVGLWLGPLVGFGGGLLGCCFAVLAFYKCCTFQPADQDVQSPTQGQGQFGDMNTEPTSMTSPPPESASPPPTYSNAHVYSHGDTSNSNQNQPATSAGTNTNPYASTSTSTGNNTNAQNGGGSSLFDQLSGRT